MAGSSGPSPSKNSLVWGSAAWTLFITSMRSVKPFSGEKRPADMRLGWAKVVFWVGIWSRGKGRKMHLVLPVLSR